MFLELATTVTLIASCFGHAPAYDERASNEAISTQSFNRDDIPISYKYTAIHVYSTQKPIDEDDVIRPPTLRKSGYRVVQYAPLTENTTKKATQSTKNTFDSNSITEKIIIEKNNKLEPRKYPIRIGDVAKSKYFVPAHNIEMKRSPNRNLNHNANYQNDPENVKGRHNEINHNLKENVKHQDSSLGSFIPKYQRTYNYIKQEPFAWMFEQKPDAIYKVENIQQNKLNPAPTHHTHRMQINVARMNGHAQVIAREIFVGDVLKTLGKSKSRANLKGSLRLNGEQRTLLYPIRQQLSLKSK